MQMRRTLLSIAVLLLAGAAGCAHHRQNQYAYAPPLAPPVYPQPALPDIVQPTVTMPGMAVPAPVYGAPVPGGPMAAPAGIPMVTPTAASIPCDPCQQGMVMPAAGGMVYAEGQTPPCPPQ
jgi:hypothetical protein